MLKKKKCNYQYFRITTIKKIMELHLLCYFSTGAGSPWAILSLAQTVATLHCPEKAVLHTANEHPHKESCDILSVLNTCNCCQMLGYSNNPVVLDASDRSLATTKHPGLAAELEILALHWPASYGTTRPLA